MDVSCRLDNLLAEAIELDRAAKGTLQIFDEQTGTLRIVAHRGFGEEFLLHFAIVKPFDGSACGRAFGHGGTVMIPDMLTDEAFKPHREIALASGVRSVKSIPIIGAGGRMLGVLSTHSPDIRWDWERDNTRAIAAQVAEALGQLAATPA